MNVKIVAPLFAAMALLLIAIPAHIGFRLYFPKKAFTQQDDTEFHSTASSKTGAHPPVRHSWQLRRRTEDIELDPMAHPRSPPAAKLRQGKHHELNRQSRSPPSDPLAGNPTNINAKTNALAAPDLNTAGGRHEYTQMMRSASQKSDLSTASTVTPEMKRESIRTAESGPLPTIHRNAQGLYDLNTVVPNRNESLKRSESARRDTELRRDETKRSGSRQVARTTSTSSQGRSLNRSTSTQSKSKNFTEEYKLQRGKSSRDKKPVRRDSKFRELLDEAEMAGGKGGK